jgi:hypothetical protein
LNQSPISSQTLASRIEAAKALEAFQESAVEFAFDVNKAMMAFHTNAQQNLNLGVLFRQNETRAVLDGQIPLLASTKDGGTRGDLATFKVNYKLCTDSYGKHLAVEQSTFELKADLDRMPVIRWDYDRHARAKPHSHVQVYAHRGVLSHLLSQLEHKTPQSFESLHIPMGSERFRPCIEDVIEFLISDCGFVGGQDWRRTVKTGRAKWRRLQTRAAVRDCPSEAAEALRALDYEVTPPASGEAPERSEKLTSW